MYYELSVEKFGNEDYEKIIKKLQEKGIESELVKTQGKNMFDTHVINAVLSFSTNVAANVIANIIVIGLGKGVNFIINDIKAKTDSLDEVEQVIQDINDEL